MKRGRRGGREGGREERRGRVDEGGGRFVCVCKESWMAEEKKKEGMPGYLYSGTKDHR